MAAATAVVLTATPASSLSGAPVTDGNRAYAANIVFGDHLKGCSGVLVDKSYVLTAASCVSATSGRPVSGKLQAKTTVTVGRADLNTGTTGAVVEATDVTVHPERNVALLKLSTPVANVAPAPLSSQGPASGQALHSAGFGRTATSWVPGLLNSGQFNVTSTTSDAVVNLEPNGDAALCQGDAGGPLTRETAGRHEVVALTTGSWLGSCLGAPKGETRRGARAVRVDDLGGWIKSNVTEPGPDTTNLTDLRALADFTGDGKADLAGVDTSGTLQLYRGRGEGTFEATPKAVGTPGVWKTAQRIFAGDFNGDGKQDIAAVWESDRILLHTGKGDGTFNTTIVLSPDSATWAKLKHLTRFKADPAGTKDGVLATRPDGDLYAYKVGTNGLLDFTGGKKIWPDNSFKSVIILGTGDFNGDGRDDVVGVWENGALVHWNGKADGTLDAGDLAAAGNIWADLKIVTGDVDGDGKVDVVSWKGAKMSFHRGRGNGTFAPGIAL
ncbi:FG-GAP-like repeat-containing protein [Streptomyces sp. UNOC14_S4]|uniref:FG-GAP-like repeat-containing protein n=1 Tax=Streptomyces sp. UNOC14_S4 TaxID=2872340 RepID=UPI001E33FA9F|nr:FG-GAP-like repeat-containing protein [Streptomyces sp. UNOC14_S4]MCC3769458.1 VCBS repeat-containing protein [Streptomyces sp. UNOC14_S4]